MNEIAVNRSDISLYEEREFLLGRAIVTWVATLDGPLSTGENVQLSRSASTLPEAQADLEKAISDEGWIIKGETSEDPTF